MLTEGANVMVTPIEFEVGARGMQNFRDLSDLEAIYDNGVFVYQVRQGKGIQLRMENNESEAVHMWWDRTEIDVYQRRRKVGSGVMLSPGEVYNPTEFRMKGNTVNVQFSNEEHEVVLQMRFKNVPAGDDAGPGLDGVHCLLTELLAHAR
jgi:hypothetical protein